MEIRSDRAAYEAPTVTELGNLAEITKGTAPLLLETDPIALGSR